MTEFNKVNRMQLYLLWRNLSFGLLMFIILIACTRLLPFYFAPVLGLGAALVFYRQLYHRKYSASPLDGLKSCDIVGYCFFYCMVAYCVISITVNVLYAWGLILIPRELVFFTNPYLVSPVLLPISFLTVLVVILRGRHLGVCRECNNQFGNKFEKGFSGMLFEHESRVQLYNLLFVFGILSLIIWVYFLYGYSDVNQNDRDYYIFVWLDMIVFIIDEIYFIYRYVNIYHELEQEDKIISDDELDKVYAKTYLRVYLICDDAMYLDRHSVDSLIKGHEVMDTPLQTRRNCNGMSKDEVLEMVESSYGISGGELKFFFGRRMLSGGERSLLRYFYFLDGKAEDQKPVKMSGEWVKFSDIKAQYASDPKSMSVNMVSDLMRIATIIITSKIYDEEGRRRYGLKSYKPSFTMSEIRNSTLDFQDNKWINIAAFNSDVPHYRIKKWWRQLRGRYLPTAMRGHSKE